MNHSVLYIPSVFKDTRLAKAKPKPELTFVRSDFVWPLLFMLCMALTGLKFYPAFLAAIGIMLKRFHEDRYDFAIMLFLTLGGFGLIPFDLLPVKIGDLGLLAAVTFAVLLRKPPLLKTMLVIYLVYAAALFWIALQSWESMRVQIQVLRYYYSFICVFVFFATFANTAFDIKRFTQRMMVFVILICCFYIGDSLLLKGHLLMPATKVWGEASTFYSIHIQPFRLLPERVYPQGIMVIIIGLIPAMRIYRMRWNVWALIAVSALCTQTFTYIAALVATLLLFQGSVRRFFRVVAIAVLCGLALYGLDCILPVWTNEYGYSSSTLRIKSTLDQFTDLAKAADDEDIAEFGSGRMAQAIPKLELVEFYGREWTGLGFLHRDISTNVKFIIENEYYTDETQSEEVATGVEIVPIQIYISAGWLGLIVVNLFFLAMYLLVCRLRYSYVYLGTLVFCLIMGIGGFASLTTFPGQITVALAFAAVVLANRDSLPGFSDKDFPKLKEAD